jgi:aconitate hydratase
VQVIIHKANGPDAMIQANHSMTAQQLAWFKSGSALNALN